MKNKSKIILISSLAAVGLFSAYAVGFYNENIIGKAEIEIDISSEIKSQYTLGDRFVVPSVQFVLDGTSYDTDFVIVYPNGNVYEKTETELNVMGGYKVIYSAEIDGKLYKEERVFEVKQDLYEVGSESLVEYTTDLAMVTKEGDIGGLHIVLKEGEEFVYNQPINLHETAEFIKFYSYNNNTVESAQQNTFDTREIVVRLTDCYNPSVYVEYEICYYSGVGGAVYYRAGSSTQKMAGLQPEATKGAVAPRREIFIDGIRYLAHYEEDYGTGSATRQFQDVGFAFSYDLQTNDMCVQDQKFRFINNLSNPDIYSTINLFEGFTTGEVYLSIRGREYYGNELNLDIERLGARSGADLIKCGISDEVAPVIKINKPTTLGNNLVVAQGENFTIFPAVAYDIHLKGDVQTRVYYNYETKQPQQVGIINGAFTPNRKGDYTIVYEAVDQSGNVSRETITLQCVETKNGKGVQFETNELESVVAGEMITVDYLVSGLNGETWIKAYAKHENGEIVELNKTTNSLRLLRTGSYEMTFEYGDSLKTYSYSYSFVCLPSDGVAFSQDFILPECLIIGATYSIQEIFAYTFVSAEPTVNKVTLYVSEDGGEYKQTSFDGYTVNAREKVQFKAEYNGNYLQSAIIPVVDVGFNEWKNGFKGGLNIENYFVGGEYKKTAANGAITFESEKKTGDNEISFCNVISLAAFNIEFSILSQQANFDGIEFTLIDYYDRSKKITLSYYNQNGIIAFGCDGNVTVVNKPFEGQLHSIYYDTAKGVFVDKNGAIVTTSSQLTSDEVLLKITLKNIIGNSAFQIKRLNQQPISQTNKDVGEPQITVESYAGYYKTNDVVSIAAATATDVLTPILSNTLTVTVTDSNGEVVTSLDGVSLDKVLADRNYEIALSKVGTYSVEYSVSDQSNHPVTVLLSLVVQERIAPTISLQDGYGKNTVVFTEVGKKLKTVGYEIKDNADENPNVFVVVFAPDMTFESLGNGGKFTVTQTGDYKVYYYVYDATGNYTSTYYIVRVS